MTIQAFKISEDKKVLLPVMVGFDGFILTHTMERLEILDDEDVERFVPPREFNLVDFSDPINVGPLAQPDDYMKFKRDAMIAMRQSEEVIERTAHEYANLSGRDQDGMIECFNCNDAEYVFLTAGAWSGDAKEAVRRMRKEGKKVGLIKLRVIRPFPEKVREVVRGVSKIVVFDREYSFGFGGILAGELKSKLYGSGIEIMSVIAGLGGKDVRPTHFQKVMNDVISGEKFQERWLND